MNFVNNCLLKEHMTKILNNTNMPSTLSKIEQIIRERVPGINLMTPEQEKLQHLANYFHEAGHSEALRAVNMACDELGNTVGRPITLEDVLIALKEKYFVELWIKEGDKNNIAYFLLDDDDRDDKVCWTLGQPLSSQSEETLNALLNILDNK